MKLDCCAPWKAPYPSGRQWTHSRWCAVKPNQKLTDEEIARARASSVVPIVDRIRVTPPRPDVPDVPDDVPEMLAPTAAHPACLAAVDEGVTPCSRCAWLLGLDTAGARYVDVHLDDGRL